MSRFAPRPGSLEARMARARQVDPNKGFKLPVVVDENVPPDTIYVINDDNVLHEVISTSKQYIWTPQWREYANITYPKLHWFIAWDNAHEVKITCVSDDRPGRVVSARVDDTVPDMNEEVRDRIHELAVRVYKVDRVKR